jgi:tetratricopeptide (TPR) repeat protein
MRWVLAPAASLFVAISSTAVWADDKRDCLEGNSHDVRIKACSAVIEGNASDAMAYYTRAVAYQFKGDLDRAISDYSMAIELNPYHASAYDGRGRAHAGKGDYTRAVADVTRSSELAAASTPRPKKDTTETGAIASTGRAPEEVKTATGTIAKIERKEDGFPKATARAPTEMKAAARASAPAKVAKKAAPEAPQGGWPAWAPQGRPQY